MRAHAMATSGRSSSHAGRLNLIPFLVIYAKPLLVMLNRCGAAVGEETNLRTTLLNLMYLLPHMW